MITTEDLEKLNQYPQLEDIIVKREIADPAEYKFKSVEISELLKIAFENDPDIDDKDDIPEMIKTFKWLEGPTLLTCLNIKKWDTFKKEVIKKDKYLTKVFNQNKLRRSHFDRINAWFSINPSLFCGSKKNQEIWIKEYKKFTKDPDLIELCLTEENDNEEEAVMTEPSIYDLYDMEAKLALVRKITIFVYTVLTNYIQKYTI